MSDNVELRDVLVAAPHVDALIAETWLSNLRTVCEEDARNTQLGATADELEAGTRKRMRWHIRRLSTFGGSDMAALYTEFTGGYFPFSTAADVIRQKLCLDTPEPFGGHTRRGTVLEPFARDELLTSHPAGLKPHPDAMEKLEQWMTDGGCKDHPWLSASPDDVLIDAAGRVYLTDYKVPNRHSAVLDYYTSPPPYYRAQLAQYKYALEASGTPVDEVILALYSTQDMKLYPATFTIEDDLMRDVLDAGDHYYDLMLRQELPSRPPSGSFESITEVPDRARRKLYRTAFLKKTKSRIDKELDDLKDDLLDEIRLAGVDHDVVGQTTRLPLIDIRVSERLSLSTSLLKEAFEALGGNLEDPALYTTMRSTSVSLIRSKKSVHSPLLDEIDDFARQSVDDAMFDLADRLGLDSLVAEPAMDAIEKARDACSASGSGASLPEPSF